MPRRNITWFLGVLLLGVLLGALTVTHAGQTSKSPYYETFKEFAKVFYVVSERYVDPKAVTPEKLLHGAYRGMMATLDPYSQFFDKKETETFTADIKGKFGGLGIEITVENRILTVVTPLRDTPAWDAGVLPGDKILKIDGKSTEGIGLREAVRTLRGKVGSKVTITVRHVGVRHPADITITRGVVKVKAVRGRMVDEEAKIGLVHVSSFSESVTREFDKVLEELRDKGMKSLILDLRSNPGGVLEAAVRIADQFLNSGTIVEVRGRYKRQNHVYTAKDNAALPDMPLVVLVDQGSASASEIVAAALRDNNRCVLVGQRTFGKGTVQNPIPLGNGKELKLTTARYYRPNGKAIKDREGIEPDIAIYMSPELLRALRNQEREDKLRAAGLEKKGKKQDSAAKEKEAPKTAPKEYGEFERYKRPVDLQLRGAIALLKFRPGRTR